MQTYAATNENQIIIGYFRAASLEWAKRIGANLFGDCQVIVSPHHIF